MLLGYIYKLRPNKEQAAKIDSWLDCLRSTYNWCLADRINNYHQQLIQGEYCDLRIKSVASPLACCIVKSSATGEPWRDNGKKRSAIEMQITSLPELKQSRPWYSRIDSTVLQQNLKRLDVAYKNFFSSSRGFPRFKNRSTFRSFTYAVGVKLKGNKIYLPKLGWIKFYNSRPIPDGFKIKSVTVRKKINGYYVSIRIEDTSVPTLSIKTAEEIQTLVGLDMGLGKLIYCSDSSTIDNPKFATNTKTKRLQRIRQRRVSRKKKRSNNRKKAQKRFNIFQHKIAQKRNSYQWQVAKKIVKKAEAVAVENLNISGMIKRCKPKYDQGKGRFLKNGQSAKRALNRLIADASWYALTLKIEYMAAKSGKAFFKVNPKHTSQECSNCHHIDLSNRKGEKFLCVNCSHVDDANLQAAKNIKQKAINTFGLNIIKKKVGRDLPEPKQLLLFETLTNELTLVKRLAVSVAERKYHYARLSKRNEPENFCEQLNLFDKENKHRASDPL